MHFDFNNKIGPVCAGTKVMAQKVKFWLKKHISLGQNLTTRSHDCGKEGHLSNCGDTSIHLPLTRSAQPSGQLPLYLLNEFNSL